MQQKKEIAHLRDLIPDKANARKHTPRNVGMIETALREVGAARSGVIDENGNVLAGNATLEALAQAGIERVKVVDATGNEWVVVRRSGLTEEQKKKLSFYDNRSAELAEWNPDILKELSTEIDLGQFWTENEIGSLFNADIEPLNDMSLDGNRETVDDQFQLTLSGLAAAFSAGFMDELHKLCQRYNITIEGDDPSRPKRRYWGSWQKGNVEKPE